MTATNTPLRRLAATCTLFFAALLFGCERAPEVPAGPQYSEAPPKTEIPLYHLAIHPLHNPRKLSEAYQPLIDHLNGQIKDVQFALEASRDYQAYEEKFRARAPEFLLPNPWQTLEAMKVGYRVIAMAGDAEDFKGIFLVRKESGIKIPADLKGKVVSYPSPTALAACIMPQQFLHDHGVDVNHDIENRYVGSQESSIMNVYVGGSAAGATWPPPWRLFQRDHPQEAATLEVIWETPPLLNNSVMVRDDVSATIANQVQAQLTALDQTPHGQSILASMETARFHRADAASYAPVREFVDQFEQTIRPVEMQNP